MWIYEEDASNESEPVGKLKPKRKNLSNDKWKIPFALFSSFVIIIGPLGGGGGPTVREVSVDDLPYDEYFAGPTDVTVDVVDVDEEMTLAVSFHKTHNYNVNLTVDSEDYGSVDMGRSIFVVPISENTTLQFYAIQLTIHIERVWREGIVNNTYGDVIVKGKMYPERYQRTEGGKLMGHRVFLQIPSGHEHNMTVKSVDMEPMEYFALSNMQIRMFGVVAIPQTETNLSYEINLLKLSTDNQTRFLVEIEEGDLPPAEGFREFLPEMTVQDEDITLSNETPEEGQEVNITVKVWNEGDIPAENCTVMLYLDRVNNTNIIGQDVVSLNPMSNETLVFPWNTTDVHGQHKIHVVLDERNVIEEYNESDHGSHSVFVNSSELSVDTDGDGLPDFWEDLYGLNSSSSQGDDGGAGDPDDDGLNNTGEFGNNTSPVDSDTDDDGLWDGVNNTLIHIRLDNIAIDQNFTPPQGSGEYYMKMHRYEMDDGETFPFAGYREPSSGYWNLSQINPVVNLSNSYITEGIPMEVYHKYVEDPIARFLVYANKSAIVDAGSEVRSYSNENVTVNVTLVSMEYAFSDPDPLMVDADWDGLDDEWEVLYWSTRLIDFRGADSDSDSLDNLLDPDSYDDGIYDGKEVRVFHYPTYSTEQYNCSVFQYPVYNYGDSHTEKYRYPLFAINSASLNSSVHGAIMDSLDADTDDDDLDDGEEVYTHWTDPRKSDTDADGMTDGFEVKSWFFYENDTLAFEYFDEEGSSLFNMSHYPIGKYNLTISGRVRVNNKTTGKPEDALNITLLTAEGDQSVSYSVSFDSTNLTTDFEEVNATFMLQLDIAQMPLQLWIQSSENAFGKFSPFRAYLDDLGVDMYGVDPNKFDMDSDGYNDTYENDNGISVGKTDTESDYFCDKAEVDFWQIGKSYTPAQAFSRAKDPDSDGDGIPDGLEIILGLDVEGSDPDNDGLTDYQEAIAFVGMFITFIDDHIVNQGNFTRPFSTVEEGIYMVKIMSEDSVARRVENVSDHWIPGQHLYETPTNDFMRESVNITILKDNETVGGVVWYTGCAVQPVSKESGWLNITEKRFFAVYGNLSANTSYDVRFELLVTEDAVVDMQFNSIQLLKQGLDPFNSDSDGDGLSDGLEMQIGSDPFTAHSDRDEVNDYHEYMGTLTGYSTNPAVEDTDGDGLWDGNDTNVQGGGYKYEFYSAQEITGEAEYGTNPTDTDTDDDGLWDGETIGDHLGEMDYDTNATLWDTDGDSAPDGWEAQYYPSLDPTNHDGQNDTDSDNLTNVQEYITGTNPTVNDTDYDGIFDGNEILGLLFRTNVSDGAEGIDNYGEGENYQWIVWNGTQKEAFQYNSESAETEEKLSSTGAQRNPQIYGDYIVWENFSDSDKYDVYLYNVSNFTAFRISPADSNQTWVKIFGEFVVWQDDRNESAGYDIYLYNITDEVEVRITNDTANQTRPSIYGKYIVWSDYRHANESNGWQWEIYAYDLERGIEIRITNDTTNSTGTLPSQTFPYIHENRIVWIDQRNGSCNVYLHELSGGTFVTSDSLGQSLPMVGKDYVVWEEPVNGTLKVMVLSLKTRTTSRVSYGSSSQQNPYVSGDKVVWQDSRTGNWDVFLHNLTTGRTYQITDDTHDQTWPVVVGDTILWVDDRNDDGDVYAYFLDYALTLEDGSLVYYNSQRDELYVWEEDSVFFRFNSTESSVPETNDRPVPGYHAMELYKGPIPSVIDSDDDGIPDGTEPNWSEDTDNDGYIDSMDSDSDNDLVPDYQEVRVRFRTNADNEEFANDTWIAIELNLSNEKYKLVGYWYHYYSGSGPSSDFVPIENQTTPLGKTIFIEQSNSSLVAIGDEVPFNPYNWTDYDYFWESDLRAIVMTVYAKAEYAKVRQEASIVIGCSSDNDTTPNIVDEDSDADGILDGIEPLWYQDIDQDGYINMMDADSDGDGLNDTDEDVNFNGKVDTNETSTITMDTDSDGITDPVEVNFEEDDPDGDGIWNAQDIDSDGDGVVDGNEVRITYRTNAWKGIYNSSIWVAVCIDTDGWDEETYPPYNWSLDGFWFDNWETGTPGSMTYLGKTPEGKEVYYYVADPSVYIKHSSTLYSTFTPSSSKSIDKSENPTLAFSSKGKEVAIIYNVTWDGSPNILNNDSDNDDLIDGLEDANGNGIIDSMETDPWTKDTDGDGISDGIEDANLNGTVQADETDPLDMDTDDDGLIDGWDDENGNGTLDSGEAEGEDLDGDGEVDTDETDPLSWDTDEDGLSDGQEVGLGTPQTEDTNMTFFAPDDDSGTTVTNATDDDSDDDGLMDGREDVSANGIVDAGETDPNDDDSDGDGLNDGLERGLSSGQGTGTHESWTPDSDTTTTTDPLDVDTDDDGLYDGYEDVNEDDELDWGEELGEDLSMNGEVEAYETDPNDPDTDGDGTTDDVETKENTFWYEAEDHANNVKDDASASRGQAAINETDSQLVVHVAQDISDSERRVKVFVKCRKVDGQAEGSLRVTLIYGSEEIIENFDIGNDAYRWVSHPDLEATLSGSFDVYANDTHTGSPQKPSVWVDKIVVAYAPLTERYTFMENEDEILFSEKEDSNDTLYLEVPNGTYVSSAVLRVEGASVSDFYYGASITCARDGLTATVLSDGSVLIVGGYGGGNYLPVTELYDITNDTWVEVGELNEGRAYHTAVLLDNGKVLVAGGQNSSGYTDTAELYDPSTQTWSTTGDMKVKRIYHTATLLSNGKVLAVGGKKSSNFYHDSAELYDPSAGTWSYTGDLDTKRAWHTASRLSDGDVLVAGGANPTVLSSAEIYDVSGGSWSDAASMSTVRYYHTATVLTNGTVLVAGGSSSVTSTNTTEMYNQTLDDWYQVDDIPSSITTHTAVRLDNGDVFAAGGILPGYEPDAYVYNTTNSEWVHGGILEIARNEHAMALLDDGRVFVVGGEDLNENERLDSVEVYLPSWGAGMMLDVGKDGDIEWYRGPVLFDDEIKIRFAGEVNEYIFRHPGETNQNDNYEVPLLFSSETKGKLAVVNLTVLFEPYVSDPCDSDSDGDDVSDYLEIVRYYTHSLSTDSDGDQILDYIEIQGIGTNPAIPDTDKDGLWDGFLDEDGDGVFDVGYEHGENLDLDVEIDTGENNETNPLDPDSDDDKLLDAEETYDHAYWMEVEDYVSSSKNVSDQNASHDLAAKAINEQSQIASIQVDLPSTSLKYKLLAKARVANGEASGQLKITVGTYTKTFTLTEDRYIWLASDDLEFSAASQITIDVSDLDPTSVYVDKLLLINVSKLGVFYLDQGTLEVTFPTGGGWQVAYLKIPVSGNVYKYIYEAEFTMTPGLSGCTDPFMNIHERANESFHQWAWEGDFSGSDYSYTLDLAGELNTYIAEHISEEGFVDDNGYVRVPLWFHSSSSGSLHANPTIYLWPYVSDPLDSDTDSDFLLDGDEVIIFGTNMLSWDSDNDGLFDVVEPVEGIETSPTDSDSENDLIKDGDEVSVIFRAGNSSGDFIGYNDSTWIALPTMMFIDLDEDSTYDTWVPVNPKGNEYYENAAYAIWLDTSGKWHLAWDSDSALDFNGTIVGQASISLDSHGLETGSGDTLTEEPDGKTINFSTDDTENDEEWIIFTYTGTYLRFNLYVDGSQDTDDIFVGSPKGHPMFSDFKYIESKLESGYDYDGISTSLSASADAVAFNASFEKEMCIVSGNGSVYVKISSDDYRVYDRGSSSAVLDLEPTIPYVLEGLEVYSNSAHIFDVDSDGIVDGVESQLGLDSEDADCDDDGLLDGFEHYIMSTDPKDTDSDNDGVQDGTEIGVTDEDVISLYWNVDANMLIYVTDLAVFKGDADPMTTTDPFDDDSDDDGLEDGGSGGEDENGNGMRDSGETDAVNPDTDYDGLWDGFYDFNGDGDYDTGEEGEDVDLDDVVDSGETDPLDIDTDDDGLWDGYTLTFNNETFAGELSYETGTCDKDTDDDLLFDGLEIGLVDGEILTDSEMHSILGNDIDATDTSAGNYTQDQDEANTTDPTDSDTDDDGLLDGHNGSQVGEDLDCDGIIDVDGSEFYTETDPTDSDTDGDGIGDGVERGVPGYDEDTDNKTNPLDQDTDDDGLRDGREDLDKNGKVDTGETDPYDPDTDGDGLTDGLESNVTSPIDDDSSGVYRGTDTTAEFTHYSKTVKNYTGATENATDPLDVDYDDDGQPDGWIDGWMWDWYLKSWLQNDSEEDQAIQIWEGEDLDLDGVIETDNYDQTSGAYPNETYSLVGDSDGDLIPDGIEAYFGLDPLNESDAWEDMDGDYLSNREEYLQGVESDDPYIDNDEDHLINFNDTNDDVDIWFSAWEVEWGMDPYGDDSDLDIDDDGLNNTYEWTWQQYVNLTSADSDGDGLEDGWEFDYWNDTREFGDEEKALNYTATYDVDGDGISDGQEYEGYNVTIVWVEGEETKSEDKKVYGDPLYAYKDQNDNWLDVDEDGIPDYIESDPINITSQQNATVYQYVITHNETCIEKQFNPLMRENIPPLIEDMSVKSKEEWGWCGIIPCVTHSWTEIRVRIFDVSSYTVEIKVLDNGKYETFSGWGNQTFNAFIDIDYWSDILLDYKVRVTAVDEAGNELVMEKEIEGFFGGILEFLADIWDAIVGAVMAAWEAVVAALSWLVEFIISGFVWMVETLFKPVIQAMMEWVRGFGEAIRSSFDCHSPLEVVGEVAGAVQKMWDFLFIPVTLLSVTFLAFGIFEGALQAITMGATALVGQIAARIIPLVLISILGMAIVELSFAVLTPSFESAMGLMGAWSDVVELSSGAIAFMTAFAIRSKVVSHGMLGACLALVALMISLFSVGFENVWWVVYMLDLASLVLAIGGVFAAAHGSVDKIYEVIAPIVSALNWAVVIAAIVSVPLQIAYHGLSGFYNP